MEEKVFVTSSSPRRSRNSDHHSVQLYLWYATSVSKRLPDYIIDGVGIQPDYFIDGSIKEEVWGDFVQGIIEKE